MNAIRTTYPLLGFWDTRQGGRAENQDSCGFVDTPHGLVAVVCDGMGGGPAGKDASTLAVQAIAEYFCNQQPDAGDLKVMMQNAIEHAHQAIISKSESHPEMRGMGSTVVAVLFNSRAAIVAHIGDSRLYQLRHGEKVFRTEDHSMVADMVRSKELTEEQARLSQQTNVITKALGGKNGLLADIEEIPYEKGDRFLLCTDGIWNALPEADLVKRAAKTPSLAGTVDSIVLLADEIGRKNGNTHDNLTLALFETKEDSTEKVKMNRKAINIIRALTVLCCASLFACLIMAVNMMKPNPEKKLLEQNRISLKQKTDSISYLINKIDSFSKNETKKDSALKKIILQVSDKTKPDSVGKEEVDNATVQDKGASVNSDEKASLVAILEKINSEKESKEREKLIKDAKEELKTLTSKNIIDNNLQTHISNKLDEIKSHPDKRGSIIENLILKLNN